MVQRYKILFFFISLFFSCSVRAKVIVICHDQVVDFFEKKCDCDLLGKWLIFYVRLNKGPFFDLVVKPWSKELSRELVQLWLEPARVLGAFKKTFSDKPREFVHLLEQCGTMEKKDRKVLKKELAGRFKEARKAGRVIDFSIDSSDDINFWIGLGLRISGHFREKVVRHRLSLHEKLPEFYDLSDLPSFALEFEIDKKGKVIPFKKKNMTSSYKNENPW